MILICLIHGKCSLLTCSLTTTRGTFPPPLILTAPLRPTTGQSPRLFPGARVFCLYCSLARICSSRAAKRLHWIHSRSGPTLDIDYSVSSAISAFTIPRVTAWELDHALTLSIRAQINVFRTVLSIVSLQKRLRIIQF